MPLVAAICREEEAPSDEYSQHKSKMMEHLEMIYDCMDQNDMHLDRASFKNFDQSVLMFLAHYTKCCKIQLHKGNDWRFNTVVKFHWVAHMPQKAKYLNPKRCSTYSGETMVGFTIALGHNCLNGTPPYMVSEKLVWRWRLGMDLRLCHSDV